MTEEWRAVPGWPEYEVSDHGRMRSRTRVIESERNGRPYSIRRNGQVLKPAVGPRGHLSVMVYGEGRKQRLGVHCAVLRAFDRLPLPGEEACHKEGDPSRNTPADLRWGTRQDNHNDMTEHGTRVRGERVGTSRLRSDDVIAIRAAVAEGRKHREVASAFGVSRQTVTSVVSGGAWGHL